MRALVGMGEKAATSEVISSLVCVLDTSDEYGRQVVNDFLKKISLSFNVWRGLTAAKVKKLWSCIDRNLLEDLTCISTEVSIKLYLDTKWSSWLSVATRVILFHGAAITATGDTIVVYDSKEPIPMCCSDRRLVDKLVKAFSNQAKRFQLPRAHLRTKGRRLACLCF